MLTLCALASIDSSLEARVGEVNLLAVSFVCLNALGSLYYGWVSHCVVGVSGVVFSLFSYACHTREEGLLNMLGLPLIPAVAPWAPSAPYPTADPLCCFRNARLGCSGRQHHGVWVPDVGALNSQFYWGGCDATCRILCYLRRVRGKLTQ